MAKIKITPTRVDRLRHDPEGPARQVLWDTQIPGFGVRVYPSGRKSYILVYGPENKRKLITMGPAVDGSDLEQYRDTAQTMVRQYRTAGADPKIERERLKVGTVRAVVTEFINRGGKRRTYSDAEKKRCRSRMDRFLAPHLDTPVPKLTRRDVREMHEAASKTAPFEANRTVALLRAAINQALADGTWNASDLVHGENPALRIELNQEKTRKEWIRPDEIPAVIAAIDTEEDPFIRAFFRMALFTGARRGELLGLRWDDVDLAGKTIIFRDTKNKTDHTVPLAPEAVELLKSLPKLAGNPYVFCGRKEHQPLVNPDKPWKRITEAAGITRRVTIHDLRRTVGSLLASSGWSTQQIGKLLNHKSAITAKVYAEIADQAKDDMTAAIARMVS